MKFGSLFTGVGGFDLGFERVGMECVWQVEQDKYCNQVLERHWPNVRRYEDVRTVGKENLEAVDLICGGFPCQDLSVAGKRAGFSGERSSLWFEFERIINEMQPKWVVIENVPGLFSSANGSDFGVILKSLDGFGYGVAWRVLDSQYFGVPQRRRRVFIVASLGSPSAGEVLFERESVSRDIEKGRETREGTAGSFKERAGKPGGGKGILIDQSKAYGLNSHSSLYTYWDGGQIADTLTKPALSKGQMMPDKRKMQAVIWQMNHANEVYRDCGDISPTLQNRMGTGGNNVPLLGVRRLTPTECCRLQGFDDDWNDNVSDTQRYRQMGNAITTNVVQWLGKRIISLV
jgi:DNA (cytosine-5)-methyltransferase 1